MRRQRLALIAAAAALALTASTPLASSAAPAKAVTRYFALAGSGSHLLYAARTTSKAFDGSGGTQYVLDAKRHRTTVPAGYRAYLVGDDPLFRKETVGPDGITDVHWIRPEHGTSGTVSVPEGSSVVGAAPNGWVIRTQTGEVDGKSVYGLRRVSTDGTTTDLGTPLAHGAPFTLYDAPTGLLVISQEGDGGEEVSDGTIRFMRWSAPGQYRRLYPEAGRQPQIGTAFYCGTPSSTLVVCNDENRERTELLSLDGSAPRAAHFGCTAEPNVRTFAIVWTDRATAKGCRAGRVGQTTTDGKRTVSTRTYWKDQQPVPAFGKLVVATATQRHLVTISTPRSTPKQIVGR